MTIDKNKQPIAFNDSQSLRRSAKDQDRAMSAHFYAEKGERTNGAECWYLYPMAAQDRAGNRAYDEAKRETFDTWASIYKYVEHEEKRIEIAETDARRLYLSSGKLHGGNLAAPELPRDLRALKPTTGLPWITLPAAVAWYCDGYAEGLRERASSTTGEVCGAITYGDGARPLSATVCGEKPGDHADHGKSPPPKAGK